jgi:hypothetical protein
MSSLGWLELQTGFRGQLLEKKKGRVIKWKQKN